MNDQHHGHTLSLVIFRHDLLYVVRGPACEILDVGALAVEVGEYYDLLLVVLAQVLGDDHVVMGVQVVQLHDVVVPSEVVGYLAFEGGRGEAPPEDFLALDHGLVRLGDASVEVKVPALLGVGLELPGELFLIILLKLLLNGADNRRDLLVLAFPEELVHFLIGVVAGIQVDKTFQGGILFILFEPLFSYAFLPIISYFFQHERHYIRCCQ